VTNRLAGDGHHLAMRGAHRRSAPPATILRGRGLILVVAISWAPAARGQGSQVPIDSGPLVDAATRFRVVGAVSRRVRETYVFPRVGDSVSAYLHARLRGGFYDGMVRAEEFAVQLTTDLRAVSHDQHLHVTYEPETTHQGIDGDSAALRRRTVALRRALRRQNFGVQQARFVADGVGYLRLTSMQPPSIAGEALTAAMTLLANSDALIIDVRENGGGDADQVTLLLSYLFDGSVEFGEMRSRDPAHTEQSWTQAYVGGQRYGSSKPIFVLTSHSTFSAAEAVAYFLQAQRHAVVVGDTTRGGANPGDFYAIGSAFVVFVPTERAVSPLTGKNWEGTGVIPNVAVPAAVALDTATVLAAAAARTAP